MTTDKQHPLKKILVLIEMVGEHYWSVLLIGLALFISAIVYGYFLNHHTLFMFSIYGAIAFVFALPALLIISYLLNSLFDLIRKR